MFISEKDEGLKRVVSVEGRLDAVTSPKFEQVFTSLAPIVKEVVLDFSELTYISSLGLRAVLRGFKLMKGRGGSLKIKNIPFNVRGVFEISGFIDAFVRDEKLVVIEKETIDDCTTYSVLGTLDADTSYSLNAGCIENGKCCKIILDCAALRSITKEGCAALISLHEACTERGVSLSLENLSAFISGAMKSFGNAEILEWSKKRLDVLGS